MSKYPDYTPDHVLQDDATDNKPGGEASSPATGEERPSYEALQVAIQADGVTVGGIPQ